MFYLVHTFQANKSASLPMKIKNEKPVRKRKTVSDDLAKAISFRENRGPNMSRKIRGSKLYPFPCYDKCDSLLFFPSTFSSCMNSADMSSLEKLLKHRTDRSCSFFLCGKEMDLDTYLCVFGINNEMHPDSVVVVHQTKVVENQIRAVMYMKYTENRAIRRSIEQSTKDPTLLDACPTPRSDTLALNVYLSTKSEEEKVALTLLADSAEEIEVYSKGLLVLTYDEVTHKITRFDASCEFTSFSAVV